jgi:hypothetical protein
MRREAPGAHLDERSFLRRLRVSEPSAESRQDEQIEDEAGHGEEKDSGGDDKADVVHSDGLLKEEGETSEAEHDERNRDHQRPRHIDACGGLPGSHRVRMTNLVCPRLQP